MESMAASWSWNAQMGRDEAGCAVSVIPATDGNPTSWTITLRDPFGRLAESLLEGARGQAPVDLNALATGLQHISQLATDYPQIKELDINPFIVGSVGTSAYVADARMTLTTIIGAKHA